MSDDKGLLATLREQVMRLEQERDAAREDVAHLALLRNDMLKELRRLRDALQRISVGATSVPGLAPHFIGHARRIAEAALASPPPPRTAFQEAADIEAKTPITNIAPHTGEPSMNIPGQQVCHQIITHECRTNRGNDGALDEALSRIREAYWTLVDRGLVPQAELHLALIVQMDRHRQPPPPRTYVGDGKPLPPGVWLHRLSNGAAEGPYIGLQHKGVPGKVYTFVGPVPAEEEPLQERKAILGE